MASLHYIVASLHYIVASLHYIVASLHYIVASSHHFVATFCTLIGSLTYLHFSTKHADGSYVIPFAAVANYVDRL